PYGAREPDFLTWVLATLVDTSVLVYSRYVCSLTVAERHAYYDEQKLLAEKFGIPPGHVPDTYADFNHYFDEMLASDRIALTDALRDVVDATVRPELPFVAKPLVEALNLATVGML